MYDSSSVLFYPFIVLPPSACTHDVTGGMEKCDDKDEKETLSRKISCTLSQLRISELVSRIPQQGLSIKDVGLFF